MGRPAFAEGTVKKTARRSRGGDDGFVTVWGNYKEERQKNARPLSAEENDE
jgi:hypothetical protein